MTLPSSKGKCDYCDKPSLSLTKFESDLYNDLKCYYLCETCKKRVE